MHPNPNKGRPVFKTVEQLDRLRRMMLGLPVTRISRTIPWGYKVSDTDPDMLEPVEHMFKLLLEAKKALKYSSYKNIAAWLVQETGVPLNHSSLKSIMDVRQPDDRCALPRAERELI
jgi:hypothetical protein